MNIEPSNLVSLKICNTEFDYIIMTFTDQNCSLLEIEDKVNLTQKRQEILNELRHVL